MRICHRFTEEGSCVWNHTICRWVRRVRSGKIDTKVSSGLSPGGGSRSWGGLISASAGTPRRGCGMTQIAEAQRGFLFLFCFVHFVVPMGISPMGNSGRFPQGKPAATESRYPTLTNFSACWDFSRFHNPQKSKMDYMIFNMHTWLFLCVVYTWGVGPAHR